MKNVIVFFAFLFVTCFSATGQNLVPNPGFEEYYPCNYDNPNGENDRYSCDSRYCSVGGSLYDGRFRRFRSLTPKHWFATTSFTVGFFNDCNIQRIRNLNNGPISWYQPRSGDAFIYVVVYSQRELNGTMEELRSYPSVKLSNPLEAGCYYEVSFYVKKVNNERSYTFGDNFSSNRIACDRIGAYVSKDSLHNYNGSFPTFYDIVPQIENPSGNFLTDSVNYVKISGTYKAEGGEQYLTIGNFRSNAETSIYPDEHGSAQYFIDDVSVIKIMPDFALTDSITLCRDSTLALSAPEGMDTYSWSTGDTTQTITVSQEGLYQVNAQFGCFSFSDTVRVNVQDRFQGRFSIGEDTLVCSIAQGISIRAPDGYDSYQWSTGENTQTINVFEGSTYSVEARYTCGTDKDTIKVSVFEKPEVIIQSDQGTSLCQGSDLTLHVSRADNYDRLLWNTGETSASITVNKAGEYFLNAVTKEQCPVDDRIRITLIHPPEIKIENQQTICEGIEAVITAEISNADSSSWNGAANGPSLTVNTSGIYTIEAFNQCFTTSGSVMIETVDCRPFIPNLVTPNGDGKNDKFLIRTEIPRSFQVEIYNRWGKRVYTNDSYTDSWPEKRDNNGIYFYRIYDKLLNQHYEGWIELKSSY